MIELYHISNWEHLKDVSVGDIFTLRPGTQCAQGRGVYFSEGTPSERAADGCRYKQASAVVKLTLTSRVGVKKTWYRSKGGARRGTKPRTWHSAGKMVECRVIKITQGSLPVLECDFRFVQNG